MADPASWCERFQQARERAGLSLYELAEKMALTMPSIRDIEMHSDELSSCYSPADVKRFCNVLGLSPAELLGIEISESPISASELVEQIQEACRLRGMTLEQFEDVVGWRLSAMLDPPQKLLQDMTIDGLQSLCRELGIDWQRAMLV